MLEIWRYIWWTRERYRTINMTTPGSKVRSLHKHHVEIWPHMIVHGTRHDDVIKWKPFPRYWPFVRRIHRSPVNSPHKGQWRGALMFSLICVWINDWVNNGEAGDLRRYHIHYDVTVMYSVSFIEPGWRRGIEKLSVLLALCEGNHKEEVMWTFGVIFIASWNILLKKQSGYRLFEIDDTHVTSWWWGTYDVKMSHVTLSTITVTYILVKSLWLIWRPGSRGCHWIENSPDNKIHGANMGPPWVLLAPDWPHVGPMNLAVREYRRI